MTCTPQNRICWKTQKHPGRTDRWQDKDFTMSGKTLMVTKIITKSAIQW